jgi:hypothetical protein
MRHSGKKVRFLAAQPLESLWTGKAIIAWNDHYESCIYQSLRQQIESASYSYVAGFALVFVRDALPAFVFELGKAVHREKQKDNDELRRSSKRTSNPPTPWTGSAVASAERRMKRGKEERGERQKQTSNVQ